jgi:hypothetical protein
VLFVTARLAVGTPHTVAPCGIDDQLLGVGEESQYRPEGMRGVPGGLQGTVGRGRERTVERMSAVSGGGRGQREEEMETILAGWSSQRTRQHGWHAQPKQITAATQTT